MRKNQHGNSGNVLSGACCRVCIPHGLHHVRSGDAARNDWPDHRHLRGFATRPCRSGIRCHHYPTRHIRHPRYPPADDRLEKCGETRKKVRMFQAESADVSGGNYGGLGRKLRRFGTGSSAHLISGLEGRYAPPGTNPSRPPRNSKTTPPYGGKKGVSQ